MAQPIQAYQSLDGQIYRTAAEADRADDDHRYQLKKQAVEDAVAEIQSGLPDDHPTQPRRKGGDAWRSGMTDFVLDWWKFIKIAHEHYDELAAVMESPHPNT